MTGVVVAVIRAGCVEVAVGAGTSGVAVVDPVVEVLTVVGVSVETTDVGTVAGVVSDATFGVGLCTGAVSVGAGTAAVVSLAVAVTTGVGDVVGT
jgi:hypothetical protein